MIESFMFFCECFIQNFYISFEFLALNTQFFEKSSQDFIMQESHQISEDMLVMLHVISIQFEYAKFNPDLQSNKEYFASLQTKESSLFALS
jgi:hypothetical protein